VTEIIEGAIRDVQHWKEGNGADVFLDKDPMIYYYEGEMSIFPGPCRLEIKDGEGKQGGKKLILDCKKLPVNIANGPSPVPMPPGGLPQGVPVKMVQMKESDLHSLLRQRASAEEAKFKALDVAARVFDSMHQVEVDPVAAADKVVKIADLLKAFLQ